MPAPVKERNKGGRPKRTKDKPRNPFSLLRRRRYHIQTVELTGRLIRETWGNLTAVARLLGVCREAVELYIKAHPELNAVLREAREVTIDLSEWQLRDAIFDREPWAIKLVLETIGKHRGYVRGLSVGGQQQPDGSFSPVPVTIILPQNGREFGPQAITNGVPSDEPDGTGGPVEEGSGGLRPDGQDE